MRANPAGWPYQDPDDNGPGWTGDDARVAGRVTPGWPYGEDHPSWPAGSTGPNWTAGDGGWPAADASPAWPYGEDHPSWPAGSDHPDWPRGGGAAYYDVPAEDDWDQILHPAASTGQLSQITANGPAEPLDAVWLDTGRLQGEDSVRLTQRILSDADSQAAAITQEALGQASAIREAAEREAEEIRRQAAYEADAAREAERVAGELKRQAAEQAEAMREAAEREADELRAGAIRLSAELGEVAAYVTRTLPTPAMPVPELPDHSGPYYTEDLDGYPRSGGGPQVLEPDAAWEPETQEPETWETETWEPETWEPETREPETWLPPGRPATRHGRRTEKPPRSRQSRTMLAFAGTITALVVLVLGTGAYQLATRGFTFFVFRSAGTGATDNNAVFPGIIPAPKPSPAHQHPKTGPGQHGARRARHHAKKAAGR